MKSSRDILINQMEECREFVSNFTCQLFNNYQIIGSGVFVVVDKQYFLISSAHVINTNVVKAMRVSDGKDLFTLKGIITNTIVKNKKNDEIDIVVFKLDDETVENIKTIFNFMNLHDLELNHKISDKREYYLFGYPNEWTRTFYESEDNKGYIPTPLILRVKSKSGKFIKVPDYKKNSKIIVDYNNNDYNNELDSKYSTLPNPKGLSGCGLWYMPMKENVIDGKKYIKLVGIVTDFYFQDNAITVTVIDIITEVLRQRFDKNVEQSQLIKVNLIEKNES
ncbi:hypothetical protein ITJ86_15500 [Winogradskyella sp. F6397]|uniref:Serine protease n=1 Tax=Winogradskyella marina TaxID=2785530 RepID=A0ABS0ELH1_9FLAO|nr:hypothetical protein [Winogradskyella marina]MBF8151312.1 hypothetical protein [Winogradskyella marina]